MKDDVKKLIELAKRAEKLLSPLNEVFDELKSIQSGLDNLSGDLRNAILLPNLINTAHKVFTIDKGYGSKFDHSNMIDLNKLLVDKLNYLQENKESAMMYLMDREIFKPGDIVELTNRLNYNNNNPYVVTCQNIHSNSDSDFKPGVQFLVLDTSDKFNCRLALITNDHSSSFTRMRKQIYTVTHDQLMSNFVLDYSTNKTIFKLDFMVNGLSEGNELGEIRLYKNLNLHQSVENYHDKFDLASNYILWEHNEMFGHMGTAYFVDELIRFKDVMLFIRPNHRYVEDYSSNAFMGYTRKRVDAPYQLNWNITKRNRIQGILADESNRDMVLNILETRVLTSKSRPHHVVV